MWVKSELFNSLFTHIAGGYSEVEIPSPIPNLEVKHLCADNTAGFTCGNVGRCQLLSFFISFYLIKPFVCLVKSFFFALFLLFYILFFIKV